MPQTADIERFRRNYEDEVTSAALHTMLAQVERYPVREGLFKQLTAVETDHANLWRGKLVATGVEVAEVKLPFKVRMVGVLARSFGIAFVLPTIANAEFADRTKYADQPDAHAFSASARAAIESAGGSVTVLERPFRGRPAAKGNALTNR